MSAGVITSAHSFKKQDDIASGPRSLCGFKSLSSFSTPLLLMVKDLVFGYVLPEIVAMAFRSSLVKALSNCSLRMVDFPFGSL